MNPPVKHYLEGSAAWFHVHGSPSGMDTHGLTRGAQEHSGNMWLGVDRVAKTMHVERILASLQSVW